MPTHPFALHFAAMCRFEVAGTARAAQLALLSRNGNDAVGALVSNDAIHPDAVTYLLSKKLPANMTAELIGHMKTSSQIDLFLENERRDTVIAKAVLLFDDVQALRALHNGGKKTRSSIVQARHLSDSTRIEAASSGPIDVVSVAYLLGDVEDQTVMSDENAWDTLQKAEMPAKRSSQLRSALQWMFHKRPSLFSKVNVSSPDAVLSAAAGSIDIPDDFVQVLATVVLEAAKNGNRWPLLAAVANPRFEAESFRSHMSGVDDVTRGGVLEQIHWRQGRPQITGTLANASVDVLPWLKKRAFSSENSPARPAELVGLATNPNMREAHRQLVGELIEAKHAFPAFAAEIDGALVSLAAEHNKCDESCGVYRIVQAQNNVEQQYGSNDHCGSMSEELVQTLMETSIRNGQYYEIRGFCLRSEEKLGDNQERWDTLWALLDQIDPSTSYGEWIDISAKL
jgi:hypothetical protein